MIDATLLRHPIPGAKLSLWTDASDKAVMQLCQNNWEPVAFVSETLENTDVRHINGTHNAVADALSRIEVNQISNSFLDFEALSKAQLEDNELQSFQNDEKSSLVFKRVPSPVSATELICDTSTGSPRPFVPHNFRRTNLSIFTT
ncbi:transposon Ty3-G Gag-Pol polyprotein [Trichonephila clavipes]|nr:transposon Ty3-G Gag-Pol polyprotein [Trichonephila clavipes]